MENNKIILCAEDCVKVANKIYFISKDINIVFEIDLLTREINIVDSIPEESILSKRLGAKILCWRDELIFAPMTAKKIWRYSLKTKIWKGYERESLRDGNTGNEMFDAVLYGDNAFIIGSNYPAIMCINLLTEEVEYIKEPYDILTEKRKSLEDCYFRTSYVHIDDAIYLATCLDNKVLRLNLNTKSYEWISVGAEGNRYSGITWDGKDFWLSPRMNTSLVRWDGKECVTEYKLPDKFCEKRLYFLGIVSKDKSMILPAFYTGNSLIMNKDDKVFEELDVAYYFYKNYDDISISLTSKGELIITEDNEIRNIYLEFDRKILSDYIKSKVLIENIYSDICVDESSEFDITTFCELLSVSDETEDKNKCNGVGKVIWEKIRN